LKSIADGTEKKVTLPASPNLGDVSFSPDGKRLSFTNTKENGIELGRRHRDWTGEARERDRQAERNRRRSVIAERRRNVTGSTRAVRPQTRSCRARRADRAQLQENHGKAAPTATYEDMIKTNHDEDLFEYYFYEPARTIDSATGRKTLVGRPGSSKA